MGLGNLQILEFYSDVQSWKKTGKSCKSAQHEQNLHYKKCMIERRNDFEIFGMKGLKWKFGKINLSPGEVLLEICFWKKGTNPVHTPSHFVK